MNAKSICCLCLLSLPLRLVAVEETPKPFTFARYQGMMDHSPFAVATAVVAPAGTPSFAKDLYVANAAHLPNEDVATIASNADKNLKEYVTNKLPNDHGYIISNMEWSDKVGATKVTIGKDNQFATLPFNQALISQPLASGQGGYPNPIPQPGTPEQQKMQMEQQQKMQMAQTQQAVQAAQPIAPMPIPTLPTPPPRVRGVIPRNPALPNHAAVRTDDEKVDATQH
ncbi:MAG: hypothetical protein ABJB09_05025 [Verrucomicrobiota bacterium]